MAADIHLHDTDVLLNRNTGIGGSDAARIMKGEWHSLWLEKLGRKEPENLDHIFRVQLGKWTEPFHIDWFGKITGFEVLPGTAERHPEHLFMFAHFDAWTTTKAGNTVPLQVKHSNERATHRETAMYYMPQIAHECLVAGTREAWFSVIPGNLDPVYGLVEPDPVYIEKLFEMEKAFWWHVESETEPEIIPKGTLAQAESAKMLTRVAGFKAYDFGFNNQWLEAAARALEHEEAANKYDAAVKDLKALVPEDAAEITGGGFMCKRDRAGRLRFTKVKK